MKPVLYLVLFISFVSFTESKCSDFKTGKFKYKNSAFQEWTITRNDSIQLEESSASGVIIYSKVEWITDCEYKLTCTKIENSSEYDSSFIGAEFVNTIFETTNSNYKCISISKMGEMEFEILKIK